jgi:hypothetical protein
MKKPFEFYPLDQSPLFRLRSRKRLATILGVEPKLLRKFEKDGDWYREWDEPKSKGGFRRIENPQRDLKLVQGRIAKRLAKIMPPKFLFCPVKGRSYVSNAAAHIGNRVVQSLDIKNYFPSTSSKRVFRFFYSVMECDRDIAGLLTQLATYKGHLPTGSPLSPILAYFAHADIWGDVSKIAESNGLVLTVYIDDVTLSGERVPDRVMWEVKKAISRAGLKYHKEKKYVDRPAEVTGLIVLADKLAVPNRQHKKKHELHREITISGTSMSVEQKKKLKERAAGVKGQFSQVAN